MKLLPFAGWRTPHVNILQRCVLGVLPCILVADSCVTSLPRSGLTWQRLNMAATAGFPVMAPGRPGLVALGQGLSCGLLDGAGSHRVSL